MKNKISLISIILILSYILAGCAWLTPSKSEQFNYTVDDGEIKILSIVSENENHIEIPNEIDGFPVTVLGEESFYQKSNLKSISLPQSLEKIEGSPFYRCYSLESIHLPENVQSIDANPFFRCSDLKKISVDDKNNFFIDIDGVLFNKERTELISYPEGRSEEAYTIPSTVQKINVDSFGYHSKLKEITILSNVINFPEENMFIYPDEVTLVVEKGSAAEEYAQKHDLNIRFIN